MTTITLPWPPTVNTYWRRVNNRTILSAKARAYRALVHAACLQQAAPKLGTQRVSITITARPPDRRKRDLDNLLKGVLDSLVHANLIHDDSQVDDLRITRGPTNKPDGHLVITIEPIESTEP